MKKIILTLFVISSVVSGYCQRNNQPLTWFSLSLKGGYGTSLVFNQPSFEDKNIQYAYYSPSYFAGGKLGLIFGDYVGASFEVDYNTFSQKYTLPNNYSRTFNITNFEYGFWLNFQASSGFYFDIGPKFCTVKTATLSPAIVANIADKIEPQFSKIAFGIGFKPLMTQLFEIKLGITGSYSLSSIVSNGNFIIPIDNGNPYPVTYTDGTTHPIQLMANVEFIYVFGKYGRASCGKNRFMINQ